MGCDNVWRITNGTIGRDEGGIVCGTCDVAFHGGKLEIISEIGDDAGTPCKRTWSCAETSHMRERADARRDSLVCMVNGENCELAVVLWSDWYESYCWSKQKRGKADYIGLSLMADI